MNSYFDLQEPQVIADVESLLTLNVQKTYFRPGDETRVDDPLSIHSFSHSTSGIFRGQIRDWPLVPKCFRGLADPQPAISRVGRDLEWLRATYQFGKFCQRAAIQNPAFPSAIADRMSIAQHFGVPTPLLDWSQSIFTAVFFAIRDVFSDEEFEKSLKVFVYHVIDERLLDSGLPEDRELSDVDRSAFIKPYHIDRRIERQRGAFTFHPHPAHHAPRIPARVYIMEGQVILQLIDLMKGFGFTEDYFFPDYAGIASAVMSATSL